MINIIAALTQKQKVIGQNNSLPWRLPLDLKRFKELTLGHPVIIGRKSYEAIGQALKGRKNFVLTRNGQYSLNDAIIATSLEESIKLAEKDDNEVFVIGGEQIFKESLEKNLIDRMYLTIIKKEFNGDTFFPEFDESKWKITESKKIIDNEIAIEFRTYEKLIGNN